MVLSVSHVIPVRPVASGSFKPVFPSLKWGQHNTNVLQDFFEGLKEVIRLRQVQKYRKNSINADHYP